MRLTTGSKTIGSIKKVMSSKRTLRNTKLRIYKTIVRPAALKGLDHDKDHYRKNKNMEKENFQVDFVN